MPYSLHQVIMCLRDELSAEVAGIAWVHFIVKLRTGVKMGGAMSLIAIGWDGYIRASDGAHKMKKESTHYGQAQSSKMLYLFGIWK